MAAIECPQLPIRAIALEAGRTVLKSRLGLTRLRLNRYGDANAEDAVVAKRGYRINDTGAIEWLKRVTAVR
jgi:hypothetical protein